MSASRRRLLSALLCLTLAPSVRAQDPAPAAPPASLEERLAKRAAENRHAVSFRDGAFSGPGWDLLVEAGRNASFFLVGEEHGVAEIPALVGELFRALQPAGYRRLAIEISPPMATVLDQVARGERGLERLADFFREHPPGVAFFTLSQEAELLVAARAAVAGETPVFWGLDYEVTGDRYLLDGIRRRAPAGPARAAAEALHERSSAAWKTVSETKNPAAFFSFSAPPEALDELRAAWPDPDPESALALDTIRETLAINQLFVRGRNWESNDRRARFNRRQLLRHLAEASARGESPRVLMRFGASHMVRGRNVTEVFDLGSLAAELAAAEGTEAFHLLVAGGPGTEHAVFNPVTLGYEPAPASLLASLGLSALASAELPDGFTLIDLRPLRPLVDFAQAKRADPELVRAVHGFDALLVLTGSHPSQALP